MTEESEQSDSQQETNESSAKSTTEGIISVDGKLAKGWTQKLADESLRGDKTLESFTHLDGISKSMVHVRRQVPMDKTAIPTDHFSDADWDAFHKAGGKPETAGDYNITRPDDFPEEHWRSKEGIEAVQDFFHSIGLSQKHADMIVAFNNAEVLSKVQDIQNDSEYLQNTRSDRRAELWGSATNQRVNWSQKALDLGTEDFTTEEIEAVAEMVNNEKNTSGNGGHILLQRMLSNIGSKFAEHGIVEDPNIPTPGDIQDEVDKATQHPAFMDAKHPLHEKQVELVSRLIDRRVKIKSTKTG